MEQLNSESEWEIIKQCMYLLNTRNSELANEKIITMLSEIEQKGTVYPEIWASIIEAAGFYPYLVKLKSILSNTDIQSKITMEYFSSNNIPNIYFHEKQKSIVEKVERNQNVIVSAPTSFGKSLLIEEVVASNKYKQILIIQPTLALLDETRRKLSKYNHDYKILVHTSQTPDIEKGNIYLFTAERVLEYQLFTNIDFFVLDEFYKLSKKRDDERADVLNNAVHYVLKKYECKFMMLGPNIDNISNGFSNRYNADFIKTKYTLVLNKEIPVYKEYEGLFGNRGAKKDFKEKKLFELLVLLKNEPTIIFCSSPNKVRKLAKSFMEYLIETNVENTLNNIPLIEWIDNNVSPYWSLARLLEYKIGVHDGALPKHITSSIIKYFTDEKLNFLFCTTTIIEGVNTCAKNIVYFDSTKGNNVSIDYFDYCNIRGRAGRMMMHYVGNIYNFNKPPKPEQTVVDIPFYEQENISDEILINLDKEEMKYPENGQNQYILNLPEDIKAIFQKNGVSVRGQEKILREFQDVNNYHNIVWSGKPTYEQLSFLLNIAWNNLLRPGESTRPMTASKLVKLTFDYGNGKTINEMIKSEFEYKMADRNDLSEGEKIEILDEAIQTIFQVIRHWFQYKVPKWITVLHSLQEYVCNINGKRAGNYLYYSSIIENDSIPNNVALLMEYNIPSSTIKKIMNLIPENLSDQELVKYIFEKNIDKSPKLIDYERELLANNLINY